jgi:hypothetical protein
MCRDQQRYYKGCVRYWQCDIKVDEEIWGTEDREKKKAQRQDAKEEKRLKQATLSFG